MEEAMKELSVPRTIDECVELAAECLPEGWELVVTIESGGYSVKLIDPKCAEFDSCSDDSIKGDMIKGINIANGFV